MVASRPGRWSVRLAAAACALVLPGCSLITGPPPLPYLDVTTPRPSDAAERAPARCPRDGVGLGAGNLRLGPGPTPGVLPAGFVPAQVRRCRLGDDVSTSGPPRSTVDEQTSAVTARLLAALTLPDQAFDPRDEEACAAVYRPPLYLLLLDGRQHAYRPVVPEDPCGDPRAEVVAALDELRPTVVTYTLPADG